MVWAHPGQQYRIPLHVDLTEDPEQLEREMVKYITETLYARQPEDVYAQIVMNETVIGGPLDEEVGPLHESGWTKIPDLVCKAFKTARAAAPNIKLMYNDYGFETCLGWEKHKCDKIFNMIKENMHCGIDAVGF